MPLARKVRITKLELQKLEGHTTRFSSIMSLLKARGIRFEDSDHFDTFPSSPFISYKDPTTGDLIVEQGQ